MSAPVHRPGTGSTAAANDYEKVAINAFPPKADTITSCDEAYAYLDEEMCARGFKNPKLTLESTYGCSAVLGPRLADLMVACDDVKLMVPFPMMVMRAHMHEATKPDKDATINAALGTKTTNRSLGDYVRINGGVELDGVTMRPFVLCRGHTSSEQERYYMVMTPTPYRAIRPILCYRLRRLQAPGTIMLQLWCGHVVQARDTFSRIDNGQVEALLCPVEGCTESFVPM